MHFPSTILLLWRTLAGSAVALVMVSAPMAAHAEADPLIEGARQCTQYFPVEERNNNIPTHLLAAIATTESGRWHDGLQMSVPWPWTINVEGKGYYFATKAEAIAHTQNFLAKGYESIDVGCMQVNLKHHPKAFRDLNQAFEPSANVAYAAKFLNTNYASLGDWIKATAAYHSRTPVHGQRYLGEIEKSWNKIVGKVAAARASKSGASPAQVAHALGAPSSTAPTKKPAAKAAAQPRVVASNPTSARRSPLVVKVSDAPTRRENEVMVVRAEKAPLVVPVTVADASAVTAPPMPQGNSIRRVALDNPAREGEAVRAPHYVFAN